MGRSAKLNALRHIAMTMGDGTLIPVLSFLAGRLDRVHFVRDLEGADVWIHLSGSMRLWPRTPFRASIDGAAIHNPITFIDIAALRDDDVYVRVDLSSDEAPEWYRNVLEDEVQDPKARIQASIEQVRDKTNLALDAYRTASEALDAADEDQRKYLTFVLETAKEEMRALNAQLTQLENSLNRTE